MNIKIAKTMLILCIVYIVGFYILKFIFPEYLLLTITDPNVLKFGEFLQSWTGYLHLFQTLSSIITYYLFICACRGNFKLKWYEFLYILSATIICKLVNSFFPDLYVHTSTCCMFILAWLCKGKMSYTVISFALHGFLSQFLFGIRGFETIISKINYASAIILTIEGLVWLVLLSILFYLKEKKNGRMVTTISQQDGK